MSYTAPDFTDAICEALSDANLIPEHLSDADELDGDGLMELADIAAGVIAQHEPSIGAPTIVVMISGGIVQRIVSDQKIVARVIVVDNDTRGIAPEELTIWTDSAGFSNVSYVQEPGIFQDEDARRVADVFDTELS